MSRIVFHGPNDDPECRRFIRRLAREWGGKVSYNSFFNARQTNHLDGWFSEDTIGKAAYCVQVPLSKRGKDRKALAGLIRQARRIVGPVKFRTFY